MKKIRGMLTHLYIRNYALISELDIIFTGGFSVLTGETGAGKSIILDALGLIRGERAETRNITEGEKKAVVEAVFELDEQQFKSFFSSNDLDFNGTCVIRRELTDSGKSRAFVNDTPVQLSVLRTLSSLLIDIHSQHENLLLKDAQFQLQVVDIVAKNDKERREYEAAYQAYRVTKDEIDRLEELSRRSKKDSDYIEFQFKQLDETQLVENEENELEQELQVLEHAEEIKSSLSEVSTLLYGDNGGAVTTIKEAINALKRTSQYLPKELTERLNSTYIELRDIADEAVRLEEDTDFDPARLQFIQDRLDLLNSLMQKHHCQSVKDLIILRDEFKQQLNQADSYDEQIALLRSRLEADKEALTKASKILTKTRLAQTEPIAKELEKQLSLLGIAHAKIEVNISQIKEFTECGQDIVQFYFAANKNQTPRPVEEVASGGEMARIMLCIKALTAEQKGLPTIIFDEVDTGISGEVANNMGELIQQMAKGRQIIAITHLPQIASKGDSHYKVYKQDTDKRTETNIRQLTDEERITEIATLLSGGKISQAAIDNAKEILREQGTKNKEQGLK